MSLRPGPIPTSDTKISMIAADAFHREHAIVELAIRDLKQGAGLDHIPSGHYHANAAWLACAVLAHNLGTWTTLLADQPPATNRTRRTRLISIPAVIANRSRQMLIRLPTRWPWATAFTKTLNALRA
ncbi:MAG: IS1380 family transposase, partial [Actinomycetia bacterium]|nr:IS1380 family transposase [Actinomycetes bacterium]